MFMSRFWRLVTLLLFVGVGCQTTAPQPTATNPQPTSSSQQPEAGSAGTLTIYSGRSESLVQPLIDQFEQLSGITVEIRYGNSSEMAATLLEEGANSPADLFYAQDPGALGAVADAGMFVALPDDLLAIVPQNFASPDKNWVGVSGRARVVVYNTNALTPEQLPQELEGFTDAQWKGKIGWAPTNGSFQAMVTGMRAMWGEEKTTTWLEGMIANEPIAYENNTAIVQAVGAGEIEVGLVNHYYLYRFLAEEGEDFTARNYFLPTGGPGSLIMVSGAGILETAQNKANAETFLRFLLSVPAQQYFASQTYEYPLIEGVVTDPLLPPLAELHAVAAQIPLSDLADLQGTSQLLSDLGILP